MKKILQTTRTILLSSVIVFGLTVGLVSPAAFAAEKGTGQALEIAPPVVNLTADPGQKITTELLVRDVANVNLVVNNQINDFVASGEDGTPKLLLDPKDSESPYSLKDWVQPIPQVTLKPKDLVKLPLIINVPANASPGGYYAVVRFTGASPDLKGTGVSLSASLGALVLLRVNGDAKEGVQIASFYASQNDKKGSLFESTPIDFVVRTKNTGNVHEQPTGQVSVTDSFGNKVANVNINLQRNNVLPSSTRKFSSPLDKTVIGNRILFGRYVATVKMTYGSENKTLTEQISFWIIPYKLIALAVLAIAAIVFLIRAWVIRYKKKIISQTRRRRR
ncbi:MAG TPA: hypothetical protein PL051_00755 [Candidatus Saccharibacteria bacterium]|nr:hypothetical protein [Candidatus Saccharibacteria bacterium]